MDAPNPRVPPVTMQILPASRPPVPEPTAPVVPSMLVLMVDIAFLPVECNL